MREGDNDAKTPPKDTYTHDNMANKAAATTAASSTAATKKKDAKKNAKTKPPPIDVDDYLPPIVLVMTILACSGFVFVYSFRDVFATGRNIGGTPDEVFLVRVYLLLLSICSFASPLDV